jgi:hypothetical protein
MRSMICGAVVAALVTLPAFGADGWVNQGPRNFDTHAVSIDELVGNLSVAVRDRGPVTLQVSGLKPRVDAISSNLESGTLVIRGEGSQSVWDWRKWFDFSNPEQRRGDLQVKLSVPRGTSVSVDGLIGDAQIGDTMGPLHFAAVDTDSTIGHVGTAHISLAGSGHVAVGDIDGDLHADSAGAGNIKTGNARSVHGDLAGAGSLHVGAINDLHLDIAGSGEFSAARVNGGVHTDILGSGSVNIGGGTADPLHVDIAGSGNFVFDGVAVDPHISALGSGVVKIKAYRGTLHNDGMASVKIGDKEVRGKSDDDDDN